MTATPTPAPLLEDDLKQLRDKLEHVPPEQWEACGFDVRTIRTDEGGGFAVADCTNSPRSGDDTSALARYIAAANPERIARLLANIAEQRREIELARERAAFLVATTRDTQEACAVLQKDAARWRYAIADGGNQSMNFMDIYDDWNGEDSFVDAFDAAIASEAKG